MFQSSTLVAGQTAHQLPYLITENFTTIHMTAITRCQFLFCMTAAAPLFLSGSDKKTSSSGLVATPLVVKAILECATLHTSVLSSEHTLLSLSLRF